MCLDGGPTCASSSCFFPVLSPPDCRCHGRVCFLPDLLYHLLSSYHSLYPFRCLIPSPLPTPFHPTGSRRPKSGHAVAPPDSTLPPWTV